MAMDLNEAREKLDATLGDELREKYFSILNRILLFGNPMSLEEVDAKVTKILVTKTQLHSHYRFLHSLFSEKTRIANAHSSTGSVFEYANLNDYVSAAPRPAPQFPLQNLKDQQRAKFDFFLPDAGFLACKIYVSCWENNMKGAEAAVTDLMIHACQVFVKNIITAMVSKKKGYKIRDGRFQYGFNQPIPDPFISNYRNVMDDSQESKVEVSSNPLGFIPRTKTSMERAEQQKAFEYSCAKRRKTDNLLTVRLLYDTLKSNPRLLGLHSIQSAALFKLSLQIDD